MTLRCGGSFSAVCARGRVVVSLGYITVNCRKFDARDGVSSLLCRSHSGALGLCYQGNAAGKQQTKAFSFNLLFTEFKAT